MKTKIQGLVLSTQEYKEKDALVRVLTDSEIFTLLEKGLYKKNAKNLRLAQPFSYNEFMIEQRNGLSLLLTGQTIQYYFHVQEDLLKSSVCFVVQDAIYRSKFHSQYFDILLEVWNSAHKNLDDFYFWACLALKCCIEMEGVQPYVDGCVHCSKTKVETLSLKDGGFLCASCNHGQYPKWSSDELKKIRALIKCDVAHWQYVKTHFMFDIYDFLYLSKWIEYHSLRNLASLRFLSTIYAL